MLRWLVILLVYLWVSFKIRRGRFLLNILMFCCRESEAANETDGQLG